MNNLYDACCNFRKAIEISNKNNLAISFMKFPYASCGDTCELLARYLYENGFGVFEYVSGERQDNSTHAWLERDGIIVDITSDQFGYESVYVGEKTKFYLNFKEIIRRFYYENSNSYSSYDLILDKSYNEILLNI